MKLCECGCRNPVVLDTARFLRGHNSTRGIPHPSICGENHPMKRPEVAKKSADSNRGISRPSTRGKSHPWMYGDKNFNRRPEIRERRRLQILGSKNPNYRDGNSNEPYPSGFIESLKEQIRDRDNHICQLCGIPEAECLRKLDVHHIDYVKANLDWYNLISLCGKDNSRVNSNRTYWIEYFRNILKQEKEECVRAQSRESLY